MPKNDKEKSHEEKSHDDKEQHPDYYENLSYTKPNERRKSYCEYGNEFYEKLHTVGEGKEGKADLFLNSSGHFVVVKVEKSQSNEFKQGYRFLHEARMNKIALGFSAFYGNPDIFTEPHYILMPFIQGELLKDFAFQSTNEFIQISISIINKIIELHEKGILHMDIHKENIKINKMQNGEYQTYLLDYGRSLEIKSLETSLLQKGLTKEEKFILLDDLTSDISSAGRMLSQLCNKYVEIIPPTIANDLKILFERMASLEPDQRLPLKSVQKELSSILEKQKIIESKYFESSKKLLINHIENNQKRLKHIMNSKGVKEKYHHYESIKNKIKYEPLNEEKLIELINTCAIISHHRRRRTADQMAGVLSIGISLLAGSGKSISWNEYKKLQFPKGSIYKKAFLNSLSSKTRFIFINGQKCSDYETYRKMIPSSELEGKKEKAVDKNLNPFK
jgi:tRNA A-37 threonylcarbamoyl transferase component Bud32